MKTKRIILILTVFSILSVPFYAAAEQEKETLKIYLPREITIEGSTPKLGQVVIIRGSESLVSKAKDITVGHISAPEQNVVVTRDIVLSRLACNGIPASCVTLSGAEETCIKRQHQFITGSQFVEEATAFLKNNLPDDSICQLDAIHTPDDLILPGTGKDIKLVCRLIESGIKNQCKVEVTAFQNNQEIGRLEVPFRTRYHCRKVVTKTAIIKGELISAKNVTVENGVSDYPEPAGWTAPYGLVANRSLAANTAITGNMVGAPQPEVLIKRNQSVAIKIESAGLVASAIGKAMQDGAVGGYIKVQNVDSKIIIMAKVNEDGTVGPVF
jgi:flagella basal body P-ring formation protein FlgA